MPMTDGNTTIQGTDQTTLVAALRQALSEDRASKTEQSKFESKLSSLLGREDVHGESLKVVADLIKASQEDVSGNTNKIEQELTNKIATQVRDQRALDAIEAALLQYTENDELLQEAQPLLQHKIINDLLNKAEYADARKKFESGQVDRKAINELAKTHVERFYKLAGKDQPSKGPAMKEGMSSTAAVQQNADEMEYEDLNEYQREIYKAHKSMLDQHKNQYPADDSKWNVEGIHKRAMKAALGNKAKK